MAATKLNPAAPPFFHPHALHHFVPPPPPPPMVPCHAGVCWPPSPHGTIYLCDPFPVPSPHLLHHHHYDHPLFGFPVLQQLQQVARRKGILAAPPPPHGLPPHKLMCSAGAAEKPRAARAAMAQVTAAVPVKGRQEPPAATAADAVVDVRARKTAAPCGTQLARQKAESRGRSGARRPRKAAGPRAWVVAGTRARPPAPKFTTREAALPPCVPPAPAFGSGITTVMVRNIPNKMKGRKMIELLDDHCARANKAGGGVIAAYDVFYLPMDFRRLGNFGYAFVNFTTPAAALGLRDALHGCGWTAYGSKKIIHVCPAKIQGKEALERHFGRQKLECHTAEFLPAVYSPPRDGVSGGDTAPRRLGNLAAPRRPRQGTTAHAPRDTHV